MKLSPPSFQHQRWTSAGALATACMLSSALLLGCGGGSTSSTGLGPPAQKIDAAVLQRHQAAWLLTSAPADPPQSIPELRAALASSPEPRQVVLSGRIGAGKKLVVPGSSYPWEPGRASFVLADPQLEAESHNHGPEDAGCPFCAKKARDGSALIRFLESDEPVPIDSRTLFPIAEGQDVVVTGTARLDDLDQLVVDAQGIFVK